MSHPAPAKHENSRTMLYRKIKVEHNGDIVEDIQYLPDGQRIITRSLGGSLRVWDLETGIQDTEWEDKFYSIALSPDGKTLASMSCDGAVTLWSIDTGNITRTLLLMELDWYPEIISVCWSPDGGQVWGRSADLGIFRAWDVKSGETILGPIKAGGYLRTVCYSPDGKMIATAGDWLKIWDANTGKLLKILIFEGDFRCLAWSSNAKTLAAWSLVPTGFQIMKFDTVTWTVLDVREILVYSFIHRIFLSPDARFLATTSCMTRKVQLWNAETNQPIGTPLHHERSEHWMHDGSFSADGNFLFTSCQDGQIYIWDVSAIVKEAGLSDIVDTTPRPAPKMKGAPRIPPGFFDDALREANLRIRLSQSHGPYDHPTTVPCQRTLSRFHSFWRRTKSHGETGHHTRPRSHPRSWTRNVSGMLRRRDGSDIELREVEVPCTAGRPRNYHARKKPTASSSRPPKIHTTQKPNASSSQRAPTTTTSTLSATTGTAGASGTPLRTHIIGAGWLARFVGWICCMPIQNADY